MTRTKKPSAPTEAPLIEIIPLTDLLLDEKNANLGTVRGLAMLDDSLAEDGAGRSVLIDRQRKTIGGNKTVERAIDRGFKNAIIVHSKGDAIIAHMRDDVDIDTPQGRRMALRDNRIAEVDLMWSPDMLPQYAEMGVNLSDLFDEDEMFAILAPTQDSDDNEPSEKKGSALPKLDVTVEEPKSKVVRGNIWKLSNHTLICADLIKEWETWKQFLHGDVLFIPYPSPLTALTAESKNKTLVMVHPDEYVCGHIIDRFIEIYGSDSVKNQG